MNAYGLKRGWTSVWRRKPPRITWKLQPAEELPEREAHGVLGRITVFGNIGLNHPVLVLFLPIFPCPVLEVRSRTFQLK